jgi:hypothetical protein
MAQELKQTLKTALPVRVDIELGRTGLDSRVLHNHQLIGGVERVEVLLDVNTQYVTRAQITLAPESVKATNVDGELITTINGTRFRLVPMD